MVSSCGYSSSVECDLPKVDRWVRLPLPAPCPLRLRMQGLFLCAGQKQLAPGCRIGYDRGRKEERKRIPMNTAFNAPAYLGGCCAGALYNAGPMAADDEHTYTAEDSFMQLIFGTCTEEFEAYLKRCQAEGFRLTRRDHGLTAEGAQLVRDGDFLYVSFNPLTGKVRITRDPKTSDLSAFSCPLDCPDSAVIVQYGLYYDPDNTCTAMTANCGMFYVVKLCDNSLFLIDGGHECQFSEAATEELHTFLHELTGIPEQEPIEIAGWYFSHAHSDHMAALPRLLWKYPGQYHVSRLLFNFPSWQIVSSGYDPEIKQLKEAIRELCGDALFLKLHTGMKFQLGNVELEVLYTHEDAVREDEPARYPFLDFNSTSTVLKMTTGGQSVLWLGDANHELQELFRETTRPEAWKADVVQVAHHCINCLPELYSWVGADWALLPNRRSNAPGRTLGEQWALMADQMPDADRIYYEEQTQVFRFRDGQFELLQTRPLVGWAYDGTDVYGKKRK